MRLLARILTSLALLAMPLWAQNALFFGQNVGASGTPTAAYVKGCFGSNTGVSSIACSITGNVTNGDAIACAAQWTDATATFTSIAKSSGTAAVGGFTQPNTVVNSGTAHANQGYALVTGTGTATITLTLSGVAAGNVNIMCHDISGIATGSPLDTSALVNQASPGTGTNGVTTGNVTTTVNGDYLFAWCWDIGGNASSTAAGTGYTLRDTINAGGRRTESQVQSSSGAAAGTFTTTGGGGDTWQVGIMALKP